LVQRRIWSRACSPVSGPWRLGLRTNTWVALSLDFDVGKGFHSVVVVGLVAAALTIHCGRAKSANPGQGTGGIVATAGVAGVPTGGSMSGGTAGNGGNIGSTGGIGGVTRSSGGGTSSLGGAAGIVGTGGRASGGAVGQTGGEGGSDCTPPQVQSGDIVSCCNGAPCQGSCVNDQCSCGNPGSPGCSHDSFCCTFYGPHCVTVANANACHGGIP
jgi:hypothetical protein